MSITRCSAGLSLLALAASAQGALYLAPDGEGQVLLYPYYTVNAGQATLLTLANDSDHGKFV